MSARVEDCPATLGKMVVIGCAICMPTLAVICFICNYKQIRSADVSINQSTSDAGTPRVSPPWEEQHPIMPGDPHYQGVPKTGVGAGGSLQDQALKPSPPPMSRGRELSAHESARVRHLPSATERSAVSRKAVTESAAAGQVAAAARSEALQQQQQQQGGVDDDELRPAATVPGR